MLRDLSAIARMVMVLVIGGMVFAIIAHAVRFNDNQQAQQTAAVQRIIEKALVQCYALEGSYPATLERVSAYGVILDYDKYVYHYEWYGGNLMPAVYVIERTGSMGAAGDGFFSRGTALVWPIEAERKVGADESIVG